MPSAPLHLTAGIVLAGGRSRRMGVDKTGLAVEGISLLQGAVAACAEIAELVVVGPPRPGQLPDGVLQVQESPPYGGPVAGIAAGLAALPPAAPDSGVLVLACDLPRAAEVVAALLRAAEDPPAAVVDGLTLVDEQGWQQTLAAVYRRRSLARALDALPTPADVSMRRLVAGLQLLEIPTTPGLTDDVDDPAAARRYGLH